MQGGATPPLPFLAEIFLRLLLILLLFISFIPLLTAATFTDAVGREVVLDEPPRRIVSLVPSVTEILFALGAEEQLVAVTDACTYPEAATTLPNVGQYADPSLEQILLHRPDLVFASADMNRPDQVTRLESLNIPVFVVYPSRVQETLETIRAIGQVTGHTGAAEELIADFSRRLQQIEQQLQERPRVSALVCVMLQPLVVAGPNTIVGDILRYAGASNPVPAGNSNYPTWNMEALLRTDPEFIIVSAHPGQPVPATVFDQWPQLQAVREQRIIETVADWIHRPGPRMILGIEALAKALHPDMTIEN
jgi:iron complex transport system substrate-binding protein